MTAQLDLIIKAKSEYATAFRGLQGELEKSKTKAKSLADDLSGTTERAGKFADSLGRVSGVLERSASSFGLPAGPLKAIGDMSDVAEIGLKNLANTAVGFNAATLGVAAAAGAAGYAIGSWLNTFPAVQKAADSLIHTIYNLARSQEQLDKEAGAMSGLKAFQEQMGAKHLEAMEKQIAHYKAAGLSVKEIAAQYKGLNPKMLEHFGLTTKQIKSQDEANKKHKEAAKVAAEHATELKKLDYVLLGMRNDLDAASLSLEQHIRTWVDFKPVDLTKDIENLNKVLGAGPEMDPNVILGPIKIAKGELDRMAPTFGNALKDGFSTGLQGLGDVILGAIQGGGDVAASIGAKVFGDVGAKLGKHLGDAIGGQLGKTIGSFFGPIGTLIGSWLGGLAGKVASWFGGIFGGKSSVSKARDEFFGQWEDGFVGVQRALLGTVGEVGQQDFVKMLFDAKSMEELQRVIALIKETIASVGKDVQPVVIPVTYEEPGAPAGSGEGIPGMARGGIIGPNVLPFVPRAQRGFVTRDRPGGQLVVAHSGEVVAPIKALFAEVGKAAAAAAGGTGSAQGGDVYLDGEKVGRWLRRRNGAGLLPLRVS